MAPPVQGSFITFHPNRLFSLRQESQLTLILIIPFSSTADALFSSATEISVIFQTFSSFTNSSQFHQISVTISRYINNCKEANDLNDNTFFITAGKIPPILPASSFIVQIENVLHISIPSNPAAAAGIFLYAQSYNS